jgi:hypothetical protein
MTYTPAVSVVFVELWPQKYDSEFNPELFPYYVFPIEAYLFRHWYPAHLGAVIPLRLYFRDNGKVYPESTTPSTTV